MIDTLTTACFRKHFAVC